MAWRRPRWKWKTVRRVGPPILNGLFTPVQKWRERFHTPPGSDTPVKLQHPLPAAFLCNVEQWQRFIKDFRHKNAVNLKWQKDEAAWGASSTKSSAKVESVHQEKIRVDQDFAKNWGEAMGALWLPKDTPFATPTTPYICPIFFARSEEGRKRREEFEACLLKGFYIKTGDASGRPKGKTENTAKRNRLALKEARRLWRIDPYQSLSALASRVQKVLLKLGYSVGPKTLHPILRPHFKKGRR